MLEVGVVVREENKNFKETEERRNTLGVGGERKLRRERRIKERD